MTGRESVDDFVLVFARRMTPSGCSTCASLRASRAVRQEHDNLVMSPLAAAARHDLAQSAPHAALAARRPRYTVRGLIPPSDERLLQYLIVEDDEVLARVVARFFGQPTHVHIGHTLAEGLRWLDEAAALTGLVVDVTLPDGSGLDLLAHARTRGLASPALVLTGRRDAEVLSSAQLYGAFFLPKPPREENLRAFVEATVQHRGLVRAQLAGEVRARSRRDGFTPREHDIVLLASSGVARSDLADALEVEETTVKTLVRRLLHKARRTTLADIVSEIHREVFARPD